MAQGLPPMPRDQIGENHKWREWFDKVRNSIIGVYGSVPTLHNSLSSIQGGSATERYHLTASEYTGTGTNDFVRETTPTIDSPLINKIDFTTGLANPTQVTGRLFWDDTEHTLACWTEITGVSEHLGRESILRGVNKTGSTLSKGTLVYVSGAQGNRPTLALAKADSATTVDSTIGVVAADILNNAEGYAITNGLVTGVDTSGFTAGDVLYVSATTAGAFVNTVPAAPNHNVHVGYALNSTVNGTVYVSVDNGDATSELHDVSHTPPSITGQILVWDNTAGYYTPTTTAYGEMYATNTTITVTVGAANTAYEVGSGMTEGTVLRTALGGAHYLQVTDAGKYKITWSLTIDTNTAGDEIEAGVMINGTAQPNATSHSSVSASSEGEAVAAAGILTLSADDQVSLFVRNHSGARDIVVEHASMVIEKLLA